VRRRPARGALPPGLKIVKARADMLIANERKDKRKENQL
jgi:hypothetical protein